MRQRQPVDGGNCLGAIGQAVPCDGLHHLRQIGMVLLARGHLRPAGGAQKGAQLGLCPRHPIFGLGVWGRGIGRGLDQGLHRAKPVARQRVTARIGILLGGG